MPRNWATILLTLMFHFTSAQIITDSLHIRRAFMHSGNHGCQNYLLRRIGISLSAKQFIFLISPHLSGIGYWKVPQRQIQYSDVKKKSALSSVPIRNMHSKIVREKS